MEKVILANAILFVIIGSIWAAIGIDLKKWSSWLLGLYAFISGFLVGFVRNDGAGGYEVVVNWTASLQVGAIFAFVYMFGGATSRWNKNLAQKYGPLAEKYLKDLSERKSDKSK